MNKFKFKQFDVVVLRNGRWYKWYDSRIMNVKDQIYIGSYNESLENPIDKDLDVVEVRRHGEVVWVRGEIKGYKVFPTATSTVNIGNRKLTKKEKKQIFRHVIENTPLPDLDFSNLKHTVMHTYRTIEDIERTAKKILAEMPTPDSRFDDLGSNAELLSMMREYRALKFLGVHKQRSLYDQLCILKKMAVEHKMYAADNYLIKALNIIERGKSAQSKVSKWVTHREIIKNADKYCRICGTNFKYDKDKDAYYFACACFFDNEKAT